MKYFNSPVKGYSLQNTANVWSYTSEYKGHTELSKDAFYTAIPCYGHKIANAIAKLILGDSVIDRWKIIFPLTFSGSAVTIGEKSKIHLIKDGVTHKLEAEFVTKYPSSHIEVEAKEDNV